MHPDPAGRTNIGDRTKGLNTANDGSLTITLQHDPPVDVRNRLPGPDGPIYKVSGILAETRHR
jgi:hypothetical protein